MTEKGSREEHYLQLQPTHTHIFPSTSLLFRPCTSPSIIISSFLPFFLSSSFLSFLLLSIVVSFLLLSIVLSILLLSIVLSFLFLPFFPLPSFLSSSFLSFLLLSIVLSFLHYFFRSLPFSKIHVYLLIFLLLHYPFFPTLLVLISIILLRTIL